MASFYLDHNISRLVAYYLQQLGHQAMTARELGMARAQDGEVLLAAAADDATVVTHNTRDFQMLHDAWIRWSRAWNVSALRPGILALADVARGGPSWTLHLMAQEIHQFLNQGPELANELYYCRSPRWQRWQSGIWVSWPQSLSTADSPLIQHPQVGARSPSRSACGCFQSCHRCAMHHPVIVVDR